jgi:hypothetical protein
VTTLRFQQEHDYGRGDDDHGVHVVVRLFPPGGPELTVNALLDTGAEHSIFDKALLRDLGIADVTAVAPEDITWVLPADEADERNKKPAYVHHIAVEWLGYRMTVPIAFVPSWPEGIDNLLGMKGFFEELVIALSHRDRMLYVSHHGLT